MSGGAGLLRVLVVDDDDAIRGVVGRFFTRLGWQVDEARDGSAALELILARPGAEHDVIISDLRMPGLSGVELHDRLAAARPDLLRRLLFSTGDVSSAEAAAFVERTSCPVLEKPFELAELREAALRAAGKPAAGS